MKPDFFRHELLQDLEITYPGKYPMLVFEGLWGHCDKAGRFEWRPRQLKLDILPFLPFEMEETLNILEKAEMIRKYVVGGVEYGYIPTFTDHQRITGKEAIEGEKHPPPAEGKRGKKRGNNGETTGKQPGNDGATAGMTGREGKGREEEGNGVERSRGSRLPADWQPSELLKAWASKERPDLDIQQITAKFRDYWGAVPGSRGCKLDWDATFRNFVRTERSSGRSSAVPDYSAVIAGLKD